jgi:hypothetical protein
MFIDVIDMTDANLGNSRAAGLSNLGVVSTQLPLYGMSNGLAQMVSAVQGAATSPIQALRIWGHGGPGSQNVSAGASGDADQDFAGITADNFPQLKPLAPLFDHGGWVELRGCSVGAFPDGAVLLLDLASLLNVFVYGAELVQTSVAWSGPVACATPSGALSSCVGPDVSASAPTSSSGSSP